MWLADYQAWGKTAKVVWREQVIDQMQVSPDELQPIRFQGQYFDEETGLHYNRFRYYDPDVGMFTSRDPIGLMGGDNVFAYAPNPTGWIDPLGLATDNEPLTKDNCRALMRIIEHEEAYGKFSVVANYTLNFKNHALALDAAYPSIGGQVSIDWMMRASAFGIGTIPGVGQITYGAEKIFWNTISGAHPLQNLHGEANLNAPTALDVWYYNSGMTLKKMFAPSIEICKTKCGECNGAIFSS